MRLSPQELIGRAREMAPAFATRAARTEANKGLLDENLRELTDSGVLATLTPAVYGGHEAPIATMVSITQALSAACPSTGWVAAFYMGAAWRLLSFSPAAQREIFADKPYVLSAGQAAPLREVTREPGGYRISGQTPWSSGAVHAEWINFMGAVMEDGVPQPITFIVPRAETTLVPHWDVAGMRGTGSHDMRVENVFVPDYRAASLLETLEGRTPGQALHANRQYQLPFIPFLMCEVVPVLVGGLRGAAGAFVARVQARAGTISGVKAASTQAAQMRLARGLAAADAAETLMAAYVERYSAGLATRNTLEERAQMKLKAAFMTDLCRNAVNDLARGFGGDGFRDESPLQRYFRDLNMLAVHAFLDIDTAAETYGRMVLGLPLEDRMV